MCTEDIDESILRWIHGDLSVAAKVTRSNSSTEG